MLATALDSLITYNPWTLSSTTPLREAARLLDETGVCHWPIVDEQGVLVGTLSATALSSALEQPVAAQDDVRPYIDSSATAVELTACPLTTLTELLASGRRMAAVTDGGRVIGTLSTADFLRELSYGTGRFARELVIEHMQKALETIDSDASLEQALAIVADGASHLVVVQGDFPLGALTFASLSLARAQQAARRLNGSLRPNRNVGQLLQSAPTVPPGRTLCEAASVMVEHQLDAIAVANQGAHLVGVLTEERILQAMVEFER